MGKELHSILRLPSAIEDNRVIKIYATCASCGRQILGSELAICRLVQQSRDAESFIRKANALVYRRSTLHEEKCHWGIPTLKSRFQASQKQLVLIPQVRSRREWQLRRQMLRLSQRN